MSGLIWIQTVCHFDTLMVFLKEFFKKVNFEKKCRQQKSMKSYPVGKEVNSGFRRLDIKGIISLISSIFANDSVMSTHSICFIEGII